MQREFQLEDLNGTGLLDHRGVVWIILLGRSYGMAQYRDRRNAVNKLTNFKTAQKYRDSLPSGPSISF